MGAGGGSVGSIGQLHGSDNNPGSLSAALQLLREFGSLLKRDLLASMLQRKFPNLLRAFMSELDDVKHLFMSYQKQGEISGAGTTTSGSTGAEGDESETESSMVLGISYSKRCMDYRSLMQRIREPYTELLYHCPSNMKEGKNDLVERIISRYQQLCTTIETAVKGIYQEFVVWVENVIAGNNNTKRSSTSSSAGAGAVVSAVEDANKETFNAHKEDAVVEQQGVAEGLRRTIFCRTDVLKKVEAMAKTSHVNISFCSVVFFNCDCRTFCNVNILFFQFVCLYVQMTLKEEFANLQVDSFIDETDLPLLFHRCGLRLNNEEMIRAVDVLKELQKKVNAKTTKPSLPASKVASSASPVNEFNSADETSYDLEDVKQLWEKEKYPVR